MKKIFSTIAGLVMFSLVLAWPLSVMAAAALVFDDEVNLSLPNGFEIQVTNGSLVESIVVNDDNTLTVTGGDDTDITFQSLNRLEFITSTGAGTPTYTHACSTVNSSLNIVSTAAATITVSLNYSLTCGSGQTTIPGSSGGGGGGGGGGLPPTVPTGTSILVNSGDAETESTSIILTLGATNVSTMLIANSADFSDAGSWEDYATSKAWILSDGLGTKTVYVKFRSSAGGESAAINDTIELTVAAEAVTGDITSDGGGSASLSNGKAAVSVPAGAVSGGGTVAVTPTSSYTAPGGSQQVVGGMVYDLAMTVDGGAVTTFDEFVTLTFTYTDGEIAGISESSLSIYYWSEASQEWLNLGGTVDAANNTIIVDTAHFTKFAIFGETTAATGDLVKKASSPAVYYLGADSKLHTFVSSGDYFSWYDDFSGVTTISDAEFASYGFGENVFSRPGTKLVQAVDGETPWNIVNPKVYAISGNGILRHIDSAVVAAELFGDNWETKIMPVVISVFTQYTDGNAIESASDYGPAAEITAAPDINTVKGL